jgi:hypothetical protein
MFRNHAVPFLLALLALVLVFAGPAHAGGGEGLDLFAFSQSKYASGLATRSRVIQVAAVGMVIALLIIIKKFDEPRP